MDICAVLTQQMKENVCYKEIHTVYKDQKGHDGITN